MFTVLAIIPARGGSKSIPNKNMASAGGNPLIQWTIATSLSAHMLERIIVTTDNREIAEFALKAGVEVPFLRPAKFAQDETPGIDPILHAIDWLAKHEDYHPDGVMMLQPTSPLRTALDIDNAIKLAITHDADAVVSVTSVEHHPFWMKKLDTQGRMQDFLKIDKPIVRRQELPTLHALNGAIYLAKRPILLAHQTWYTKNTYAYVMPPERSLDIDTPWDLHLVDLILKDRRAYDNN